MAHGIIANVPAPIDMYRAVNTQVTEQMGDNMPAGFPAHIARATPDGFQVIEVWETKQQCDEFEDAVLAPIIERVSGGQAPPRSNVTEEFEVENFLIGTGVSTASSE